MKKRFTALFLAVLFVITGVFVGEQQAFAQESVEDVAISDVLTEDALKNIADTTMENLTRYFAGEGLPNEICYQCTKNGTCKKEHKERCF